MTTSMVYVVVSPAYSTFLVSCKHVAQYAMLQHNCLSPTDAHAEHCSKIAAFPGSPSECTSRPGP